MEKPSMTAPTPLPTAQKKSNQKNIQSNNASDDQNTPKRASANRHQVEVPADAPRLHGVVVSRQEKFGFIKAAENESRYFFHLKDTDGIATHGAQVTFVVAYDKTASKEVAYDVETVSEKPAHHDHNSLHNTKSMKQEEKIPGTYCGIVAAVPKGPTTVRIDDGLIIFTDANGMQQQALFGTWRVVSGSKIPGLGENVEFGVVKNTATGVLKAAHVRLAQEAALAAAQASTQAALEGLDLSATSYTTTQRHNGNGADRRDKNSKNHAAQHTSPGPVAENEDVDDGQNIVTTCDDTPSDTSTTEIGKSTTIIPNANASRQLGRITLLKKEFGFIRQVVKPGDLFFHFSQLQDVGPSEIKVGDDVEFSVRRDKDGKMSAQEITRAEPGSVVFDVISDVVFEAVVLEKPVVTKQYVQSSGVLEYDEETHHHNVVDAGSNGSIHRATNATQTDPPIQTTQGEAETDDNNTMCGATSMFFPTKRRIIFSAGDCVGGASALRPGDHVTFKIATNIAAAAAAAQASVPGVAQLAGRRAIQVTPLLCKGIVATVNSERKFGFILYHKENHNNNSNSDKNMSDASPPSQDGELSVQRPHEEGKTLLADAHTNNNGNSKPSANKEKNLRVFFHFSEVGGGLVLKTGDEVAFVLHSNLKTGELNAARVKRTKACKDQPTPPGLQRHPHHANKHGVLSFEAGVGAEALPQSHNPNKLKLTGNLQSGEHKTQYQPKMPDGTRGFAFQRTKGLDKAAAEAPQGSPFAFFAGLPLKGMSRSFGSSVNLSAEAKPFVPRSESTASLTTMMH